MRLGGESRRQRFLYGYLAVRHKLLKTEMESRARFESSPGSWAMLMNACTRVVLVPAFPPAQ